MTACHLKQFKMKIVFYYQVYLNKPIFKDKFSYYSSYIIQIFYWHKHNYNNWQRLKVKLQFMSMNRKHNNVITVFTVFRLLTDFVCLYNYEF
jgi:hypothetical protein